MPESKSEVSTICHGEAIRSRSMLSGFILSFMHTSPCARMLLEYASWVPQRGL